MSDARTFPNFLDAYMEYADDNFSPVQFNEWAGLSIIAGALERKVWLPWNDHYSFYPNIYVLLVSLPGAGKSTALTKATGLLQEMNRIKGNLNLIPSQATEAKFIELMGAQSAFQIGSKVYTQSAGYYWASEASNALRNIYGDFIACLTEFYDCPNFWEKATLKDGKTTLKNVSMNLIAGSTFDYLSKLVNDENIMGGFASRLIYVLSAEKKVRVQAFQSGMNTEEDKQLRLEYRKALVHDLQRIHEMVGPFKGTKEFAEAWQAWYQTYEQERLNLPSEKLQSLLVRTNTNLIKVSMLLSAAESSDMILKLDHFERAKNLVLPIAKSIPTIFQSSKALDTKTQTGLNNAIIRNIGEGGRTSEKKLKMQLLAQGFSATRAQETISLMKESGVLKVVSVGTQTGEIFEFVGDVNSYL